MDTLKEERWQRDKALVEQRCKEVGADCEVQVANGDDAVQTKQCDNLLTKGVDVLIVAPHNGQIAASIVEAAHKQGVPVISYDRLIRNSDVDLYVSHQVVKIGQMQAQYALDHAPKGNYVLIGGSQTDNNALLLIEGQMNVLQPALDKGQIKIVAKQYAREWLASEALFDVHINTVVGAGTRRAEDALEISLRARALGFSTSVGIIHDQHGQLKPLTAEERQIYEQVRAIGTHGAWLFKNLYAGLVKFEANLIEGRPNTWRCRCQMVSATMSEPLLAFPVSPRTARSSVTGQSTARRCSFTGCSAASAP